MRVVRAASRARPASVESDMVKRTAAMNVARTCHDRDFDCIFG